MNFVKGLMLGTVGMDPAQGVPRFTFDSMELMEGIGFVPVIMGLYGIGEVLAGLERKDEDVLPESTIASTTLTSEELRASAMPILRGTARVRTSSS